MRFHIHPTEASCQSHDSGKNVRCNIGISSAESGGKELLSAESVGKEFPSAESKWMESLSAESGGKEFLLIFIMNFPFRNNLLIAYSAGISHKIVKQPFKQFRGRP